MKSLVTLSLAAALTLAATGADAARLRPSAVVTGERIHVGDLFEGAGEADRPVAPAPAPGQSVRFDAGYLARIAAAYHIDWTPRSDSRITVSRANRTIGMEELRGPVTGALARRALGGRLQVDFDNPGLQVIVPAGSSPVVTVENIYFNPSQPHFSTDVLIGAGGPSPQRITITGQATLFMEIPVLIRRLNPGDVITRADIGWVEFNANQLVGEIAASETDLIDRTPRRGLAVNSPISLRDIQTQRLIARNQLVTMVLQTPTMLLTTQGKATQDGAKGEVIRVVNIQSNRTVDAIVSGPGKVSISVPGSLIN
ncbi:MAG: flagellar basal body P-ring formation chaperone FlgA [Rhodospirillaceae bacterium]